MDDLIRRSDAENIFRSARRAMKPENYSGQEFFIRDNILLNAEQIIHSLPAVDAVEVKHGLWIETIQPLGWRDETCAECSVCGEDFVLDEWGMEDMQNLMHYCPNCGAKMEVQDG